MPDSREVAHRALVGFDRGRTSRIADALEASRLTGRDLGFARELAFGVMRRRRLLDCILEGWMPRGLPKHPGVLAALRIGVYQLCFLRTPKHAAVNESVALVPVERRPVINAVLRRVADSIEHRPRLTSRDVVLADGMCIELNADLPDGIERLAIENGLPTWLVRRWARHHDEDGVAAICAAAIATPAVHLRETEIAEGRLAERLTADGVAIAATEDPTVLRWTGDESPFSTKAYSDGWFVVQDPTAIAAARAVDAQRGEIVIDFCAAPGTKTMLLAEAVCADGEVWAFDPVVARRNRIMENATRCRVADRVRAVASSAELPKRVARVLVDVPCSNTGVLGRRIEARYRISEDAIEDIAGQQREILARAVRRVMSGGILIYSTCSIETEENQDVVRDVAADLDLEVLEQVETLPAAGIHDGGFFARLRRR